MQIKKTEANSFKQVPRFFMLQEGYQLMANCISNSKSERSVSGASDNRNFFVKTHSISYVNVVVETLYSMIAEIA